MVAYVQHQNLLTYCVYYTYMYIQLMRLTTLSADVRQVVMHHATELECNHLNLSNTYVHKITPMGPCMCIDIWFKLKQSSWYYMYGGDLNLLARLLNKTHGMGHNNDDASR